MVLCLVSGFFQQQIYLTLFQSGGEELSEVQQRNWFDKTKK